MPRTPRFALIFAPEVLDHLEAIDRKHHGLLRASMDQQLSFTPVRETRNRKPLRTPAPFGAAWELRCGPDNRFRVFYDVDVNANTVRVLAIGVKEGARLFFQGKEFKL